MQKDLVELEVKCPEGTSLAQISAAPACRPGSNIGSSGGSKTLPLRAATSSQLFQSFLAFGPVSVIRTLGKQVL